MKRICLAAIAIAAAVLMAPPASAREEEPKPIEYPDYHGPKKTIAVTKFDAMGAFVASYGGWDIGGGLASMLAAELVRTKRFIVVDRADIDTLLQEKQMALSDVTKGTSGDQLLGAQTFIRGSVTEFDQQEKGGGLSVGFSLSGGGGSAGRRAATGHVAIDLRLIDGDSGAVVTTSRVEKKIKSSSIALQGQANRVTFGGDQFSNTSLGRASREAIADAVAQIVAGMERVPFQALVARTQGDSVTINAGRNANIPAGSRMRVFRMVDVVTDPQTGETLGGKQQTIADIVVDQIEERYAVGRLETPGAQVARGDVAELLGP
jgi:curli biogenesis system outer membrane secretion channel CsgG